MGARTPQETRRRPRMLAPFVKQRLVSAHQSSVCVASASANPSNLQSRAEKPKRRKRGTFGCNQQTPPTSASTSTQAAPFNPPTPPTPPSPRVTAEPRLQDKDVLHGDVYQLEQRRWRETISRI